MTFSCKQAAELVSESMDRRLSLRERFAQGFHLLMCGMCRAYRRQLGIVRRLLRDQMTVSGSHKDVATMSLSLEARLRIDRAIGRQP